MVARISAAGVLLTAALGASGASGCSKKSEGDATAHPESAPPAVAGAPATADRIHADVKAEPALSPEARAAISVVAGDDGMIHLTGKVPNETDRTKAAQIAMNIAGPAHVVNEIVVEPAAPPTADPNLPDPMLPAGAPDASTAPVPRIP
jgi:osmotically-inducible protein OsmY